MPALPQHPTAPAIISGNPSPTTYPDAVVYSTPATNATLIVGVIIAILLVGLLGIAIWWLVRRGRKMQVGRAQHGEGGNGSDFGGASRRGGKELSEGGLGVEIHRMTGL
ncbi:hypothetical protein MMC34_006712 [Xylographa carneopallida]|nr:hypothetical protein [Xylographa carneopallida]